jgi:NTF2 fold immunity protein
MIKQAKLVVILMLTSPVLAQAPAPKNGFIPDEATAIRVAEAILDPIYGEKQILTERPFHASLNDGIWTVSGSLPQGWDGGVATIRIDKKTGTVISYIHGK